MARLESQAKMGFYSTPPKTLEQIKKLVLIGHTTAKRWSYKYSRDDDHILDPCCASGNALQTLIEGKSNVKSYGIELDMDRAMNAVDKLSMATQGSIYDTRINPLECMGALFLNPPYDTDKHERTEMLFLRHAIKWLCVRGLLIFIVPEYIFDARYREWIGQHFEDITVYRIHRDEYPVFQQVVLFGYKKEKRSEEGKMFFSPPLPYIEEVRNRKSYSVPSTEGPKIFQGSDSITDEEILKHRIEAIASAKKYIGETIEAQNISLLFPPKKGHIVGLITGGMLDNKLPAQKPGDSDLIIKGYSERVQTVIIDEENSKEITRDTYRTGIRVIETNKERGIWYDVQ